MPIYRAPRGLDLRPCRYLLISRLILSIYYSVLILRILCSKYLSSRHFAWLVKVEGEGDEVPSANTEASSYLLEAAA